MPLLLGPMVATLFASGMELWNYLKCLHILDIVLRKKALIVKLAADQCTESDVWWNRGIFTSDDCFKFGNRDLFWRINFYN